jgi:chaperone modulatory protein CbpM
MTPNFILATPLQVTSLVMEDITELTLDDLCRACAAQADIIFEMVSEGVIDPASAQTSQPREHWRFTGLHLHRAKVAIRLHRDLGVNFAGAALALELMDELQALKVKLRVAAI